MYRGYTCLYRKIWSNTILAEPGKRFSRLEAWLYITNVLATGKDDEAAGLKRGEFVVSVRQLAECFNWSRGSMLRFIEILIQNSMIMRVGHSVGQEAGHFSVCNYETYNTPRNTKRDTERDTFKEVLKESKNKIKDTPAFAKAPASAKASAGRPALYKSQAGSLSSALAPAGRPGFASASARLPAEALAKAGRNLSAK